MSEKNIKSEIKNIYDNYQYLNRMTVVEMEIASKHSGITGDHREKMWMKLFRGIIPGKFAMAQGVKIIDSEGNTSNEVDIAVYDEQYTPYVFQYNTLKFIPIEAVAMVIECKSTGVDPEKLKDWADSIIDLKSKRSGIARMVNGYVSGITNYTQIETKPIRVVVSLKANKQDKTIESLKNELSEHYHIIIQEQIDNEANKGFVVSIPNENKTLGWWAKELNGAGKEAYLEFKPIPSQEQIEKAACGELKFSKDNHLENPLSDLRIQGNEFLTLNFQLNQLLMLLNNPMLFPHFAYAKRFNEIIDKAKKD